MKCQKTVQDKAGGEYFEEHAHNTFLELQMKVWLGKQTCDTACLSECGNDQEEVVVMCRQFSNADTLVQDKSCSNYNQLWIIIRHLL